MKKSIIATGAASIALAAMPVVGVFATQAPASVVDTVKVNIAKSCTFEATQNGATLTPDSSSNSITRTFEKDATLGEVVELGGTANNGVSASSNPITVAATCNSDGTASGGSGAATWSITATSSAQMTGDGDAISTNADHLQETSGATSYWSMKIESTGAATGYDAWHVVPSSGVVASGTASNADFAFTPAYRVYVGTDQAAGTYTGTVTYTVGSTL